MPPGRHEGRVCLGGIGIVDGGERAPRRRNEKQKEKRGASSSAEEGAASGGEQRAQQAAPLRRTAQDARCQAAEGGGLPKRCGDGRADAATAEEPRPACCAAHPRMCARALE